MKRWFYILLGCLSFICFNTANAQRSPTALSNDEIYARMPKQSDLFWTLKQRHSKGLIDFVNEWRDTFEIIVLRNVENEPSTNGYKILQEVYDALTRKSSYINLTMVSGSSVTEDQFSTCNSIYLHSNQLIATDVIDQKLASSFNHVARDKNGWLVDGNQRIRCVSMNALLIKNGDVELGLTPTPQQQDVINCDVETFAFKAHIEPIAFLKFIAGTPFFGRLTLPESTLFTVREDQRKLAFTLAMTYATAGVAAFERNNIPSQIARAIKYMEKKGRKLPTLKSWLETLDYRVNDCTFEIQGKISAIEAFNIYHELIYVERIRYNRGEPPPPPPPPPPPRDSEEEEKLVRKKEKGIYEDKHRLRPGERPIEEIDTPDPTEEAPKEGSSLTTTKTHIPTSKTADPFRTQDVYAALPNDTHAVAVLKFRNTKNTPAFMTAWKTLFDLLFSDDIGPLSEAQQAIKDYFEALGFSRQNPDLSLICGFSIESNSAFYIHSKTMDANATIDTIKEKTKAHGGTVRHVAEGWWRCNQKEIRKVNNNAIQMREKGIDLGPKRDPLFTSAIETPVDVFAVRLMMGPQVARVLRKELFGFNLPRPTMIDITISNRGTALVASLVVTLRDNDALNEYYDMATKFMPIFIQNLENPQMPLPALANALKKTQISRRGKDLVVSVEISAEQGQQIFKDMEKLGLMLQ